MSAQRLIEPGAPPSKYAIASLADGEPGALANVVALTLIRSAGIIPSLMLAGQVLKVPKLSTPTKAIPTALIVSTGISAMMLAYCIAQKGRQHSSGL